MQGSAEEEWASEAVQLGGVASGMGSLGFWTGANHQEDDPIGTCPESSFSVLWMQTAYFLNGFYRRNVAVARGLSFVPKHLTLRGPTLTRLGFSPPPPPRRV